MELRAKTLRGTVGRYAFLFEAALLLGSFAVVDFFLWRSVRSELQNAGERELRWLEEFVADHEPGGSDYLMEEMREHLGARTGFVLQIRKGEEPLFASAELARAVAPGFFETAGQIYWVARKEFRGFELTAGVPAESQWTARQNWRGLMVLCSFGGLVAAALLARALARQATEPLAAVADAAERVHDQSLSERILPPARPYAEVERVRASFNEMLARLEASMERLRQFTADASHELRTPLSVLKVEAQAALGSGRLEPEAASIMASQLEEIDRLSVMVEDLLTLARLDSGPIESSPVELADVVVETAEQFRTIAETRGIELSLDAIEPALLEGDRSQLRRMVSNLLDNAIKYTEPDGRVRMAVEQNDGFLRFSVTDTGRGIPHEDLPRIFERFYRADPSRSRRSGGAGLGLAIVARIVEYHGGRVTVQSELGRGSSFLVELPSKRNGQRRGRSRSPLLILAALVALPSCRDVFTSRPASSRPVGRIEGTVRLVGGDFPPPTRIENTTDPEVCGREHTLDDAVVSPENHGVRYAIVAMLDVPANAIPPFESSTLTIDNIDCRFSPHAGVVRAGSSIEARNSDPILHTTHLYGPAEVNISLPMEGAAGVRRLEKAGLYAVRCDVHGWMKAAIRVDPHPFHAVTDENGEFHIEDAPAGTYRLESWHERLGRREVVVEVREGETASVRFEYALSEE
ncbi:MAG TPA: ATP-binding protein [Vicinamibacteria bacterium]|nr:ATP-binding protein [Vicinamibacteria bacterium]